MKVTLSILAAAMLLVGLAAPAHAQLFVGGGYAQETHAAAGVEVWAPVTLTSHWAVTLDGRAGPVGQVASVGVGVVERESLAASLTVRATVTHGSAHFEQLLQANAASYTALGVELNASFLWVHVTAGYDGLHRGVYGVSLLLPISRLGR